MRLTHHDISVPKNLHVYNLLAGGSGVAYFLHVYNLLAYFIHVYNLLAGGSGVAYFLRAN